MTLRGTIVDIDPITEQKSAIQELQAKTNAILAAMRSKGTIDA